jgi:hypothetical protein
MSKGIEKSYGTISERVAHIKEVGEKRFPPEKYFIKKYLVSWATR